MMRRRRVRVRTDRSSKTIVNAQRHPCPQVTRSLFRNMTSTYRIILVRKEQLKFSCLFIIIIIKFNEEYASKVQLIRKQEKMCVRLSLYLKRNSIY